MYRQRRDSSSSASSASGSDYSDWPLVDLYAEEGELSEDQDCTTTEPDQAISEEQTYRETMSGIRSYMGWSNIQEMDSTTTGSDDNPFSGPKPSTTGKVSVQMPTEEWLCKKLSKLNVTLVEGYPSRSSEAGGLMMDQFLRPAKSQSKWYGLSSDHKCCLKSACRGQTSKLLANLAGSGCRSEGGSNLERGLHPPLLDPAQSHKVSHSHKLLWKSSQEPLPVRGITSAYRQKSGRVGSKSKISGVFQLTFLGAQTQQQVETHPRPEQIQNGDTGNHQDLSPKGRMGHLHRFQGRLFPHTDTGTVQEISKISRGGSDIPVQGSALWSVHSTLGVHCGSKGGETDGHAQGYKDPPIPR